MILKKPYGFLIKHFKIINLILLVPILYIILKFGDIAGFFRDYVAAKYNTPDTVIAGNYITILTYVNLLFLIIYNLFIYILMKNKKKPTREYALSAIYYMVLLVLTLIFYNAMTAIETNNIDASGINLVRDIANFSPLPGYVILFLTFLKFLGFNLKTFSFDNNLDLHVTEDDEAEFEIRVGPDSAVIKKNIVHALREIKYYLLENSFVFTCLGVVLLIMISSSIYMHFGVYNKKYSINQAFALDTFTLSLKDSYITDVDYSGQKIADDTYFLAIEIGILNKSLSTASIDKSNFRIYIGNDIIYPSYDRSSRFIDIGKSYEGRGIQSETSDNYVLVYELSQKQIKKSYEMRILSSLTYDTGKLIPKYKIITVKPQNIIEKKVLGESTLGKKLTLEKTLLKNTQYKLNSIDFVNSYTYKYQHCYGTDDCVETTNTISPSQGSVLAVVDDEITYDENSSYYKNSRRNFYEDFTKIKYTYVNGNVSQDLTASLKDVTPSSLKGKKVLEVTSLVKNSQNRSLIIDVRNQEIVIKIDN